MKIESIPQDRFCTFISSPVTVKAIPMTANRAKQAGANNVPEKYFEVGNASYNPSADGYLIEFFSGYRSWNPKSEFEAVYKLAETKVDRMKIELADFNKRIKEITDELYILDRTMHPEERWSLAKQLDATREYAERLYERIQNEVSPRTVVNLECCTEKSME